jgi:ATP-dependent RNA helicase MSS116
MGLEQMTEIQAQSWPHAFNGTSCVGKAKTGTGKTLSFLLPSIQRLIDTRTFLPGRSVGILIIAPTRELAQQIGDEAERLLKYMPKTWTVQSMYGGTQMRRDSNMWAKQKPAILVSTTARLLDHIRETRVKGRKFGESILSDIPIIVLDETDRLVEGFWRDIKTISSQLPRPEKRQTLLFSATLPKSVEKSFEQYLPNDYVRIDCVGNIASGERANSQVKQFYLQLTDMDDYVCTLVSLLRSAMTEQPERFKLIVFFPTAKLARFFAEYLSAVVEIGPVWEIHSRMSQSSRSRVSSSFRSATNGILLTSDVTARGMDYPDVTCVIQVGTFLSLQNLHQLYLLLCLIFDELPVRRSL